MSTKKGNATKAEIIREAVSVFLQNGYSNTVLKSICDKLEISTGSLTFYFPTKEHLFSVLVEFLCEFQWKMMQDSIAKGQDLIMAMCMEITSMAAISEENENAKDLYLAAYSHPLTLDIIRRNDTEKSKTIYAEYCKNWSDEQFEQTEAVVSGIEYATIMTTGTGLALDVRIAGALNSILTLYGVPKATINSYISKLLASDYREVGRRIFDEFTKYMSESDFSQVYC